MGAKNLLHDFNQATFILLNLVTLIALSTPAWAIKETEGSANTPLYVGVAQQSITYKYTLLTRWYGSDEHVLLSAAPNDASARRLANEELKENLESWRQPHTILSNKVLSNKFIDFLGGARGMAVAVSVSNFSAEVESAFLSDRMNLKAMDRQSVRYLPVRRVMLRLHNEDNDSTIAELELMAKFSRENTLQLNILNEEDAILMARAWRKLKRDQSLFHRMMFRTPALSIWVEAQEQYGAPRQWLLEDPAQLTTFEKVIKTEAKNCEEQLE